MRKDEVLRYMSIRFPTLAHEFEIIRRSHHMGVTGASVSHLATLNDHHIIDNALVWALTPQGHEFWSDICVQMLDGKWQNSGNPFMDRLRKSAAGRVTE